jgi:DNA-binding transcriptional LysR family regulator
MELRDLAYFEAIAELSHVGLAAERLGRSKPALTKCIRRMEAVLGTPLFRRQGRGIVITPAGQILLEQARRFRATSEEALRDIGDFIQGNVGKVRVGTGPTVAEFIMPKVCGRLMADLPGLQVELMVELGDHVRKALREDRLDLVISTILPTDALEFDVELVTADTVVVVGSEGNPLCARPQALAALLGRTWVLSSPSAATRQWLNWAFAVHNHPPPQVQIESNSMQVLPALISGTDLLGFVPRSYLRPSQPASRLSEIVCAETTMSRPIGILYRKGGYLSPSAARLVAVARDVGI